MRRRVFTYTIPGTRLGVSLERLTDRRATYERLGERYKNDRPFANSLTYAIELLDEFLNGVKRNPNDITLRHKWQRYAQHYNQSLRGMARARYENFLD